MRMIATLFLAATLSVTSAYALDGEKQEDHPDPVVTSFKQAYAGYNKVAKTKKYHLTTYYAQLAYEYGLEKFDAEHINTVKLALNWAKAYNNHTNGHDSPTKLLTKSLPDFEKTAASDPETLIELYLTYGAYFSKHFNSGDPRKGLKYYNRALKLAHDYFKGNATDVAQIKLDIAETLYSNQNNKKALKYLLEAKTVFEQNPDENKINLSKTNFWIAKSYLTSKKHNKAAEAMSMALKVLDEVAPTSHYALTGHAFMIQILEKQGKKDEATKHCQLIGKAQPIDVNREQIPLYRFAPEYPRTSKQGYVTLEFTVDEEGFVKNPKAIDGENMDSFSKAAIKAVKDYRFAPRFENGQPVSTDGLKTRFTFRMVRRR